MKRTMMPEVSDALIEENFHKFASEAPPHLLDLHTFSSVCDCKEHNLLVGCQTFTAGNSLITTVNEVLLKIL